MGELAERQSGRTKAMVKALEPRSVVIVHCEGMARYISRMIEDVHGVAFWKDVMIVSVESPIDVYHLAGVDRPIAVDHAFWEGARSDAKTAVTGLVARRQARSREADIRKSPSPPARPRILEIALDQRRVGNVLEKGESLLRAITLCSTTEVEVLFDKPTAEVYAIDELIIPEMGTSGPYRVKLRLKGT